MTAKEKMNLLTSATIENAHDIQEGLETGVIMPTESGRPRVKMDIRAYLKRRMDEEGITGYAMAMYLGKARGNFYNFMAGKTPLPLSDIEEMLWVLDGKMTTEDEIVETKIIKQ